MTALGPSDVDDLAELARDCFASPWPRGLWAEELSRDLSVVWGLRSPGGRLVAFLDFWCVRDEIHVLNLGTWSGARRRGHARRLLEAAFAFAAARDARFVTLEVRRSNAPARALYSELGFRGFGIRPGYYTDGEDALVLLRTVTDAG